MKYKIRNYDSNTTWYDLLMNMMLGFLTMFVLALIMISTESKKVGDIESKAEFIITIMWPSDLDDDVDLYVADPLGNFVYFNRREDGLMHLERDDIGHRNDYITTSDGRIIYNENREVVTIRGFVSGEYIVNIHMYSKREIRPTDVMVKLEKINPYVIAVSTVITMRTQGDERTAFRFTVDKDGSVININTLSKRFVDFLKRD